MTWGKEYSLQYEVVGALMEHYDLSSEAIAALSNEEILEKVVALPGFTGHRNPSNNTLMIIRDGWKDRKRLTEHLDWNDCRSIPYILYAQYPMTYEAILALSDQEIIEKVLALPAFADAKTPPDPKMPASIRKEWADCKGEPLDWKDYVKIAQILKNLNSYYDVRPDKLSDKQLIAKVLSDVSNFVGEKTPPETGDYLKLIRETWDALIRQQQRSEDESQFLFLRGGG